MAAQDRLAAIVAPDRGPREAAGATRAAAVVEPGACPACAGGGPFRRHVLREMLFGTRERFEYAHCPTCGLLWLIAPPDDLSPFYPAEYHAATAGLPASPNLGAVARWLHDGPAMQALFGEHRRRARIGTRFGPQLRPEVADVRWLVKQARLASFDDPILDVGCGPFPERLEQLRRAGFRRLLGADPWIPADTTYHGIPVLRRRLEDVPGQFALLTFHHSFEHLPDPRRALVDAASHLRAGGTVLIRTPVMGSWFWDHYGTDWWELDPPRHLFVHSRRSLEALAASAGLELVRVAFDSTYVEVIASDQIARDIPWRSPASFWANPRAATPEAIDAARSLVATLNLEGTAGRANFFLRKPA